MIREMAKQMYDYYVRPYLGEKGQDLVEYALLLAIIVAVGYLIWKQSALEENLGKIFTGAGNLAKSAADSVPADLTTSTNP